MAGEVPNLKETSLQKINKQAILNSSNLQIICKLYPQFII